MTTSTKSEFLSSASSFYIHGVKAVKPNHPKVTKLRHQGYQPSQFGSKIWSASLLLIDYLQHIQLSCDDTVLELGCGWALPATYIKKQFECDVAASDGDSQVKPFQQLISDENDVDVDFLHASYEQLSDSVMGKWNTLIGADICYNQTSQEHLFALIQFHLALSGTQFILADTGRQSFFNLVNQLFELANVQISLTERQIQQPNQVSGYLLHISHKRADYDR